MKHSERKKQITHKWKTNRIITDIVLDGSQKIMKYIQSMIQNNQQPKILLPAKLSFKSKKK